MIRKTECYETTDGKRFSYKDDAVLHETALLLRDKMQPKDGCLSHVDRKIMLDITKYMLRNKESIGAFLAEFNGEWGQT
jgi:hypothetical protein